MTYQFQHQLQYSPTLPRSTYFSSSNQTYDQRHTSSIHSGTNYPFASNQTITNGHHISQQRKESTFTPVSFIGIHIPNEHIVIHVPRNGETLKAALELRASKHSLTNLQAYAPFYKISQKLCSWDTVLNHLRESDIVLKEKIKHDHSYETIRRSHFTFFNRSRCALCNDRIRGTYKRCVSCGKNYHNQCSVNASECPHPMVQLMKRFVSTRSSDDRVNTPPRRREPILNLRPIPSSKAVSNNTDARVKNDSPVVIPERIRPNLIKSHSDETREIRQPLQIDVLSEKKHVSDWEIRPEDLISHGRMVGKGAYGTVYKAKVRLHGYVALKELNFDSPTPEQLQAYRNEVIALKKISHQNTLNFYGYILSPRFAIVTQWCEGSTLHKHIHILERQWEVSQWIDIARQICQGISYLHEIGIIHRDLKSNNVFLDTPDDESDDIGYCQQVKIGDFGLATVKTTVVEDANKKAQPTGTPLWMAPEVIQQKDANCYSTKSDVYAYGCILFEMFTGKLPHAPLADKHQIMYRVGKGLLKIKVDECRDDTPKAIKELIAQCTLFDRTQRPDFSPEIDSILSKFKPRFSRLRRSLSEPSPTLNCEDDDQLPTFFSPLGTPASFRGYFTDEMPWAITRHGSMEFDKNSSTWKKSQPTTVRSSFFDSPM